MPVNINTLLPEWRAQPSAHGMKKIAVYKKGEHIEDLSLSQKHEGKEKDHFIFGRKKDSCDFVLEHHSISRQHAVLFFGEMGAVYVMDLGSSHGTCINGEKIESKSATLLSPDSELSFGQSSRRYKLVSQCIPAVPSFGGTEVVEVEESVSSTVESGQSAVEQRRQRQAQIAAIAQEMANTVPIYHSSSSNDKYEALKRAQEKAESEGATIAFNSMENEGIDDPDYVSDSDEDIQSEAQVRHEIEEKITERSSDNTLEELCLEKKIPLSHQIDLKGHTKAVACLSCEAAGNRIATGSLDYNVKLYDFGGMDMRHRAFKTVEVQDGYPVVALAHTPSGDKFVACTGSCQPKVYSRDGEEIITFVRGDMYLRDLSNTKGHTMEVTGAQWHPKDKNYLLTSSLDGSLRIWDLRGEANFGNLCNKHVLKVRNKPGQPRVGARCCAYSNDGDQMFGGATDGTIHIWNTKKHYNRADYIIEHANVHSISSPVSSIVPSPCNNQHYASRGEDGTLRLWDISKRVSSAKKPRVLKTFSKVDNVYPTANTAFSPDGSLLCCATSPLHSGPDEKSMLYFFDSTFRDEATDSQGVSNVEIPAFLGIVVCSGDSAIFVQWQAKCNQIFCSMSSGGVRVFFDPRVSVKGAVVTASRAPKREKDPSDHTAVGEIYNPNALPMYKQESLQDARRRKAEKRKDPVISKIPEKPGRGKNADNQSFFFTKYVMEGRSKDTTGMEDPREALLKMEKLAEKDPIFFGRAYAENQPVRELHGETFEQEQEQFKKKQKLS